MSGARAKIAQPCRRTPSGRGSLSSKWQAIQPGVSVAFTLNLMLFSWSGSFWACTQDALVSQDERESTVLCVHPPVLIFKSPVAEGKGFVVRGES